MPAPVTPTLFDQFASGWRGAVLVALIALVSSQFGAARTPVWDVAEARFAQASKQMLESGDFVRIRLQSQARNAKPVGAYWAQTAAVSASGGHTNQIWPYRLPSALGLVMAALATLWGGAALAGRRAAFLAASLFAAGVLAGFQAAMATADALLVGFTTLAMAALAQLYATPTRARTHALAFWAAMGCAVLVKGPVAPLLAGLTLATLALWERRSAWMEPLAWWPGPLLAALIVLPWTIAVGLATGGAFFADMALGDILPKLVSAHDTFFAPPFYHLFLLTFLIFPCAYALPAAARLTLRALRGARSEADLAGVRFLIAWTAPFFILFELAPTKQPHYVLPTYPAIALLCGAALMAMRGRRWRTAHPIGIVWFAVSGAAIVAFMSLGSTLMAGGFDADLRRAISTALIGVLLIAAGCAGLLLLRRPAARAAVLVACALALSFSLRERLIPEIRGFFVSSEAVTALTRARLLPGERRPLWVVGYDDASIVFLTRTSTRLAPPPEAGALAQAGDTMIIEGRVLEQTLAELAARGLDVAEAAPPVRGHSFTRRGRVSLFIGEVRAAPVPN